MKFTRREKHVLGASLLILLIFSFIPQQVLESYEIVYLLFVVVPIAIYVITDPERKEVK